MGGILKSEIGSSPVNPKQTIIDDLELVRRARNGDTSAFEALYRAEVGRIYAVCIRMTGDRGRAEVLTQDAFVQAWRSIAQFRGDSAFSTWLFRIAINVVRMSQRTKARRAARITSEEALEHVPPPVERPRHADAIDLEDAIADLSPQARTVLILFDVEGYSHNEIADMLEIAPGTSKAHLHRARKQLREMLDR